MSGIVARAASEAPDEVEPRIRPDLRLVPAALATWAVVLAGVVAGPLGGIAGVALATVGLLAALLRLRDGGRGDGRTGGGGRRGRGRRGGPGGGGRGGAGQDGREGGRRGPALLAAAGCALAAGVLITVHAVQVQEHPLRVAAERGSAATLRVLLTDDPHVLTSPGYGATPGGDRVLVAAELVSTSVGDGTWTSGGRVLLIAPAEGWRELLPGQEVRAEGLLVPAQRPDLTIAVLRVRGPATEVGPPPWWQSAAGTLRDGLRDAAARALPEASAGLLPGLAVGDTRNQTSEVETDFRAAGLTHLTAVSGANLAIVGGAVLFLLRRAHADPRLAALCSGLAIVGFVILARPSPSVVRAAVMGGVVLLALAAGRARSALPALAVAVLVLLVVDPSLAVDAGFALSVLATAALVLIAPGWARAFGRRGVPPGAAEALAVPAAACVVTAPLIAGLSGQVSLVTVLANLVVVPAVAPATVLGVLAAVLSPLGADLATALAWVSTPAVGWLVLVADRAAAVPGGVVTWPDGLLGAGLLALVLLVLVLFFRSPRWRALLLAVLAGLLLVLVPTRVSRPGWPPAGWAVVACDVGQGDGLVLATGTPGWAVLVDAGPDDGLIDACLSRLGVRGLALVVLSHLHADHIGGLTGALRGRAVSGIAVGPAREPRWAFDRVAREASAAGAPLVELDRGRRLTWPGLVLDVLAPVHPATYVDPEDGTQVNDTSVVLRAQTPAGSVLLTGDVELDAQADLLASGSLLRADVLKIPHHGSRYSSLQFLAAVAPRAALVSVGAGNSYRHPNPGLLEALTRAGVAVRRTDQSGDLAVVADPGTPASPQLVARGSPLPAPRRRGPPRGRDGPRRRPNGAGCSPRSLSPRGRTAPRARPCWWRARSRWDRPGRTPRRGS
ncbi:MAG: DNA internalization-related competence protein ComEC/Rec2 [Pseudonocardia sp.]|nr:DNA internalization-related competence protein ComEC/Rec2 [Pseudonocardia sp.]